MAEIDSITISRPQILIVDDLPANLGVLRGMLEGAGLDVLVATSGERALARMAHMQPDLILLDVNMPGLDGYETCRLLKADARWRDVPVLFLTAQDDPGDKVRGFEAGGVDYITKPLYAEEVLARVRAQLRICSLQRALTRKNALLEDAMARRLEAEAQLQQSLDRAVLVVDADGRIELCTRLARKLLERYFPDHPDGETLPPPLAHWLLGSPPAAPWQVDLEKSRLEVRCFASSDLCSYFMLMLEEKVSGIASPARLLHLGLRRESLRPLPRTLPRVSTQRRRISIL